MNCACNREFGQSGSDLTLMQRMYLRLIGSKSKAAANIQATMIHQSSAPKRPGTSFHRMQNLAAATRVIKTNIAEQMPSILGTKESWGRSGSVAALVGNGDDISAQQPRLPLSCEAKKK